MEGLASIAIAVAQLEEAQIEQESGSRLKTHLSPDQPPPRSGFGVRVVSEECTEHSISSRRLSVGSVNVYRMQPNSNNRQALPALVREEAATSPAGSQQTSTSTGTGSESSLQLAQKAMDLMMASRGMAERSNSEAIPAPSGLIASVLPNDVLSGRGGKSNHHHGNMFYRALVKACQPAYIGAKRRDKPKLAECIVFTIRQLGGRFLKFDQKCNSLVDVGNTKAREKTSQALREGAPEMRVETSPKQTEHGFQLHGALDNVSMHRRVSLPQARMGTFAPMAKKRRTSLGAMPAPATNRSFAGRLQDFPNTYMGQPRVSLDALATIASTVPVPPVNGLVRSLSSPCSVDQQSQSSPPLVSPVQPVPEQSKECRSEETMRGPRIKLLKRRLEQEGL